ncbi:hypothetical protein BN938_0019 [Mucinivorans hirudinis]|uniref:Uncharacterized protein n=1 Tax=Mucinivorans hirudinis TaxID=1433126 RepID=A0A060R5M8_9BACT|nr:hypothetical protein BN938_0019 [Mucinivorans hirudinis]
MIQIIIIIAIVVAIVAERKLRQKHTADMPQGHGENFPFPKRKDIASDDDEKFEWLGKRVERKAEEVARKEYSKVKQQAVVEKPKQKNEIEESNFEFDAEKAIIFSEILQPKYREYEQS